VFNLAAPEDAEKMKAFFDAENAAPA